MTGWAFADEHPRREMTGGLEMEHSPVRAFLLKDAWLIDGVLYKSGATLHLHKRTSRLPRVFVQRSLDRGALFCTPGGNRYFGVWLMDDCVTYPLAENEGTPITTAQPPSDHQRSYERLLAMTPSRISSAHFRELVIFDDVGQNRSKHRRFRALGSKLAPSVAAEHPGVFIWRGTAGERRLLKNEREIAERLVERRGFRLIDPLASTVDQIVTACAGAKVVIGVEGSALLHGLLHLVTGGALIALQPPSRFVGLLKHLTDRDSQRYGFVVGSPDGEDFHVDPEEVERTLDLLPD